MTFQFNEDGTLRQRIDRVYQYGDYWIWAFPDLQPQMHFSLVVGTGKNASACFNMGRNSFYAFSTSTAMGFADPLLTDYLVRSAEQMSLPYIMKQFYSRREELVRGSTFEEALGNRFSTLYDRKLDLTLLIDDATSLPYAIRSKEQHKVFGASTSDIVFSNFTSVAVEGKSSISLPHRVQTVYNNAFVLEDFTVDKFELNADVAEDFFKAAPPPDADNHSPLGAPMVQDQYTRSDVHEFFEAGLWNGESVQGMNTSQVVVKPIFPNGNSPHIQALYVGYADYVQMLVEFEDGLLITDAPAHRSKVVLQWVKENMKGKKITHVVPSHHHRDHAGGVNDFLAAGAILVVPEVAKSFYQSVNNGNFKMTTYSKDRPFVKQDSNVIFQSFWHEDSSHSHDWTYATIAPRCKNGSNKRSEDFVVYNVDVVNPGPGAALRTDIVHAREFLLSAIMDGVPKTATLIGSHGYTPNGLGTQESLDNIAKLAGVAYPAEDNRRHLC